MSHVIQKPKKRRGATGKTSRFFFQMDRDMSQKSVPMIYPMPIVHQKYIGPSMSPKSIPRRTSQPPTHVGTLSIIPSDGMTLSAIFSPKKSFTMSQKGKNKGKKRM